MHKTPADRVKTYHNEQLARGLKRVPVYVPDTPDAIKSIGKSAKRLRKSASLPLPRD